MRFTIRDHQRKSTPYVQALIGAGHVPVSTSERFDVLLTDLDIPHPAYDGWVDRAREIGAAIVVYPHGFTATNQHSLVGEVIEADAVLVPGPGQKELMERYDYPNPLHVVGWPGPRQTFEPRECKRVLFAPHHPFGSGWLPQDEMHANARAFELLLSEGYDLEVRHIGTLDQNGVRHEPGVRYHQGAMGDGHLNVGDVVVANTTYAAECMARGVPVVMNDQESWWSIEWEDGRPAAAPENWQRHRELTWYPYELGPGVVARAAADPNPPEVRDWRDRFLGPEFDADGFVAIVEETVESRVLV